MYKLTLYYLLVLIGIAATFSFFGILHYNPLDILLDTTVALVASYVSNKFFAWIVGATTNNESSLITALILVLIIPVAYPRNIVFLAAACVLAMLSKYVVTIDKQHLFNPAAISVLAFSFLTDHIAIWWVGTPAMLPIVFMGGLLIMRKIQRGKMLTVFFLTYFSVTALTHLFGGLGSVITVWKAGIQDSALFFFGFVMLTEPLTSPSRQRLRAYYAGIVGGLFALPNLQLFGIGMTPEIALCIGNIFSYFSSPKYRLVLSLVWSDFFANTGVFAFASTTIIKFLPGQYMEWTLSHHNSDSRGNRRYFSIASSPTEKELLLTVKFYNPSSSYKKKLVELKKNEVITATSLAGDFVLPKNLKKQLVFFAGGVGIAPFRSMVKYIIDKNLQANIVLFYANRTADEIVFQDVFEQAKNHGITTIYVLTDKQKIPPNWNGEIGRIDAKILKKYVPDFATRTFYLSGPQSMVDSYADLLSQMKVAKNHIKQDFFPGYNE